MRAYTKEEKRTVSEAYTALRDVAGRVDKMVLLPALAEAVSLARRAGDDHHTARALVCLWALRGLRDPHDLVTYAEAVRQPRDRVAARGIGSAVFGYADAGLSDKLAAAEAAYDAAVRRYCDDD